MAPGLALRPARDDDSWEIIALIGACWSEYPGCIMDVHGECAELLTPATTYATKGGTLWVVTNRCDTVVAVGGWIPLTPTTAELQRLYVAARWRRQGLAAMLAGLIERTAAEHGALEIELWSDTRFGDAHRFYQRRGYLPAGPDRQLGDLSHTVEHHYHKHLRQKALR